MGFNSQYCRKRIISGETIMAGKKSFLGCLGTIFKFTPEWLEYTGKNGKTIKRKYV